MIMGSTRGHGGLTSRPRVRRRYLTRCHARTEAEGCQIFRILKRTHTFLLYMKSPNSEILARVKCDTEPARVLNTTTEATWPGRPRCDSICRTLLTSRGSGHLHDSPVRLKDIREFIRGLREPTLGTTKPWLLCATRPLGS